MDRLTREQRTKTMRAIKSQGSKIETTLARALFAKGLRYRKNDKSVYGKPDLTFKKYKIAIFVDSEFFHGHNWEERKHNIKTRQTFWHTKIERNIARDKEVNKFLEGNGWTVIRFWGNEVIKHTDNCVHRIMGLIEKNKSFISK